MANEHSKEEKGGGGGRRRKGRRGRGMRVGRKVMGVLDRLGVEVGLLGVEALS